MKIRLKIDSKPVDRPGRRRSWRAWAVPVVLVAVCAVIGGMREGGWKADGQSSVRAGGSMTVPSMPAEARMPRLVFPYSVVPGGIEAAEIAGVLSQDAVVEAHYRGFRADLARTMVLDQPKMVYVSYRVKDQVYWTRNKVELKQGEKVITDGKELIRSRCGNRISDAPMAPTALMDPPEVSADTAVLPQPLVALAKPGGPPQEPVEEDPAEPAPVVSEPVAKPEPAPSRGSVVPFFVPVGGGGGGVPPGVVPPSGLTTPPAGTQPPGGSPPPKPPVTPPAPSAEPPSTKPPTAPPATAPPAPPGDGPKPSNPPPNPPPGGPGAPPSNPPTPSEPPSTPPSPPVPSTPPVTPPSPEQPNVVPPSPLPPGPIEPPLPGAPPSPNGIIPPGPNPLPPPGIDPPLPEPPRPLEPPPITPVPEPSTYALIGAGLAAMAWLKSRRKRD
ncbi:MAG: PEP-CTERM sorting domain-containing protein [Bryobacteraceae bacterium]|nr:PEP-CTERM sorting domain-containing protein [Bryobacteraceae bacterium]